MFLLHIYLILTPPLNLSVQIKLDLSVHILYHHLCEANTCRADASLLIPVIKASFCRIDGGLIENTPTEQDGGYSAAVSGLFHTNDSSYQTPKGEAGKVEKMRF